MDETPLPLVDLLFVEFLVRPPEGAEAAVAEEGQDGDVLLGDGIRLRVVVVVVEGADFLSLVQLFLPYLERGFGDVLRLTGLCMRPVC